MKLAVIVTLWTTNPLSFLYGFNWSISSSSIVNVFEIFTESRKYLSTTGKLYIVRLLSDCDRTQWQPIVAAKYKYYDRNRELPDLYYRQTTIDGTNGQHQPGICEVGKAGIELGQFRMCTTLNTCGWVPRSVRFRHAIEIDAAGDTEQSEMLNSLIHSGMIGSRRVIGLFLRLVIPAWATPVHSWLGRVEDGGWLLLESLL